MTEKILFVDDEENILLSIRRELRKRFEVHTAISGDAALEVLKSEGPFAVIISDMRMPVMNGIQLLAKVRDLYPDTVRIMLTGNADQDTAIEAVNRGQIFRFLNKPCPTSTLVTAIALALHQYRLITAERELLDKTLKGSVTVLSELLSMANPIAFSSGLRVKRLVVRLVEKLGLHGPWQYEMAALLSQIGCITLPNELLSKVYAGHPLNDQEEALYRRHPHTGARLIEKIPRLETVAAIIEHQLRSHSDLEMDDSLDEVVVLGAQVLKVSIDFDARLHRGTRHGAAIRQMQEEQGMYHPEVLSLLAGLEFGQEFEKVVSLQVRELSVGMIAEQDIKTSGGVLIVPTGQEITWSLLQGLLNFSQQVGIQEPVMVRVRQEQFEEA